VDNSVISVIIEPGIMYKFLDNVATADVAFEVESDNLDQLFSESAQVLFQVMADLSAVESKVDKVVELDADSVDKLLFDWLSELVYLKDKDYFLFSKFEVNIVGNGKFSLKAHLQGEPINLDRHNLKVDVKAVTYHMFYLKKENGLWRARIVLDI